MPKVPRFQAPCIQTTASPSVNIYGKNDLIMDRLSIAALSLGARYLCPIINTHKGPMIGF